MDAEVFYVVVGAVLVAAIARWRGWPAPLLVTVVALAVSFLPIVPNLQIDGHLLLSVVLPPLLYSAALDVSFVNFRASLPQIRKLGIGLVLLTTLAVGLVAWWLMPSLTLPGALLLGAIVAPPDAVSAAAIGRKLGLPRRVMTVLSGESLINDATSLTLYRVFAAIVAGATLTVWDGVWQFALAVLIGIAVGMVFAVGLHQLRLRVADPVVMGTFGLLVPFGAYAIAEHLQGSGVLAVVAMGLYVGYHSPRTSYVTRIQERPLWLSADFLLESFVFAYIGLQLPRVVSEVDATSVDDILLLSGAVLLTVLIVRPLFVYPSHAWSRWWQRRRQQRWQQALDAGHPGAQRAEKMMRGRLAEPPLTWRDNAVISWAGMRGVVTLATALAAADLAGLDSEAEHAIVVVAFIVTVGTLMLQGLTLPLLIRRLDVSSDAELEEDQRQLAGVRKRSMQAGVAYLQAQRAEWLEAYGPEGVAIFDRFARRFEKVEKDTENARSAEEEMAAAGPTADKILDLMRGWIEVRREQLLVERDAGTLNEEVMRELIVAIDAEELALDTRADNYGR